MILFLTAWLIRIVMTPVVAVRQRRPPVGLAWLAVIYLMPWPGLLAYLLIGESRLGRRRLLRRLKRQEALAAFRRGPAKIDLDCRPSSRREVVAVSKLARRLGGLAVLADNRVELLDRAETVIERLTADIEAAERHVHLLFYIFRDDEAGWRVGRALAGAAARGVACRVLVDDVGSRGVISTLGTWLRERGVRVVRVLPVNPLRSKFARLDIRNHRKLAVIDGRVAYTGSQNLSDSTFGPRRLGVWRDIMARVEGPGAWQAQFVFTEDWFFETDEMLDGPDLYPEVVRQGRAAVQIVPTGPDHPPEGFEDLLGLAILAARRRVVITTPYFAPGQGLMQAMRLAMAKGVQVDLILPRKSDHPLVDAASRYFGGLMLGHGARLWLHGDGLLHAKTLTVDDDVAMVGTANFDIRSFSLNLEMTLFVYDGETNKQLARLQAKYLEQSSQLTLAQWGRRPLGSAVLEHVGKLLSPLL